LCHLKYYINYAIFSFFVDIRDINIQRGSEITFERALNANQRLSPDYSLMHSPHLRAVAC